jgi:hypothetical protein
MRISEQLRVGAGLDDILANDFRGQIRALERKLEGLSPEIDLPSEDDIADNPKKYEAKMKKALSMLQKISAAIKEYNAFNVY